MRRRGCLMLALALAVLDGLGATDGGAASAPHARDVALAYLSRHARTFGLASADTSGLVITDRYTSAHSGVTHVYLRQAVDGIQVVGTEVNVNIARDGSVMSAGGTFIPAPASSHRGGPRVDAVRAVKSAGRHLRRALGQAWVKEHRGGAAQAQLLSAPGLSTELVPARLVYLRVDNGIRLAWQLEIEEPGGEHWWNIKVDAETEQVLDAIDYVTHDQFGTAPSTPGRAAPAPLQTRALPAAPAAITSIDSYRVYALPKESPYDGDRTLEIAPSDALASPLRWHDTNGVEGAEFTVTRGNNVHAYTDLNADNVPDPGSDPDGGSNLVFDFPLDLALDPSTYRPAAVTNLFYWNNVMHDVSYHYGFNEAAGNFQVNQYGHSGLGNDDVRAEAQDGSGTNNANFGTPVDGARPRMQVFIWTSGLPNAVIVSGGPAAGTYPAAGAAFGPQLSAIPPVSANAVVVNDGVAPESDGCEPLVGFPAGSIAVVDRGLCGFTLKVAHAQAAGAVGVVVVNNVPGDPGTMGGFDATITIPAVMVGLTEGTLLKANAPFAASLTTNPDKPPNRDGTLDAGIIAHEYTHGISNRLTGGPSVVSCLNNAEQMGEGWSDFVALVMTAKPGQTRETPRGLGAYASFQPPEGAGVLPTVYTTDLTVNPTTYGDVGSLAIPRGVGYAWASMLWEVYWNLVDKHGFNPNIYGDWTTGGNNLAFQLVMDGMKFQPCRPGFVDGRDAILSADRALTGGANQCAMWQGFAKRGLGLSANQGLSSSTTDGVEAFDLPPSCQAGISVSPASLATTQGPNTSTSLQLDLTNTSAADGEDLNWNISEAPVDCSAPSDLPWVSASPASGATSAASTSAVSVIFDSRGLTLGTPHTGKLCIASNAAGAPLVEVPVSLTTIYDFRGFFAPVVNPPAVNSVRPGPPVRLRFRLGGNFGEDIMAAGSPSWQQYDCTTEAAIGPSEPARVLIGPRFIRDRHRYLEVVATRPGWRNTCRRLTVTLNDGTIHPALFMFRHWSEGEGGEKDDFDLSRGPSGGVVPSRRIVR